MSTDLALLASDPTSLDVYDDPGKQIELACQRANAWLKAGIDVRIETIVETKAQAAALAAFAIQKQLGHDAELAALEVQRRAERGIGLAIRRGQELGEIATPQEMRVQAGRASAAQRLGNTELLGERKPAPSDFVSGPGEFTDNGAGIYHLTDGVTDDQFEDAIEDAKAEGNLSRANVVRKVKGQSNGRLTGDKRLDRIRTMGAGGHTAKQIADELGHTAEYIRRLARESRIDLPAERLMARTASNRRIDSNRIAREAVRTLDGLASALRLINYDDLDMAEAVEWAISLSESTRPLNRFLKQIKEMARD